MKKIYALLFITFLLFMGSIKLNAQCLSGWTYSMQITINNPNPVALTNHQVKLTLNTAALVSAGHMQASGNDIRFTQGNCCNNLFHTVESGMNTASTVIWVKLGSIPAGGSVDIQFNYGNPSASSADNANATFDLWEPFDNSVNHFSPAGCGSGTYTVSGGAAAISWPSNYLVNSDITFDLDTVYTGEMMINSASGNWPGINFSNVTPGSHFGYSMLLGSGVRLGKSGSSAPDYCRGENWASTVYSTPVSVVGLWSVTWISTGNIVGDFPGLGTLTSTDTEFSRNDDMKVCLGGISGGTGAMNIDWVRVRKYSASTPTFTVGSEMPLSFQAVSLGSDTSVCDISAGLTFDAGAGFISYSWAGIASGSSQTTNVNTVGQVIINAVDASSCPSTDTVNVSEFAPINLNIGADLSFCDGDSATLDAGSGFVNYSWSSGGSGQFELVDTAGNYVVNVTDVNGCTDADTVSISLYPLPISSFTFSSTSLATTFTNTSTGGTTYFWNFGDGNTSTNFDTVHVFTVSGTYNVCLTVINSDNCQITTCTNVTVANTGMNNELADVGINVYPNPAKDIVWIKSNANAGDIGIIITDMLGKTVLIKQPSMMNNISIDLTSFVQGNYIIHISAANRHYYTPLIITR